MTTARTALAAQTHEPRWPVGYREGDAVMCSCGTPYQLWGSCEYQDRWRRHDDNSVTKSFMGEIERWYAACYEAPAGYDAEMEREALENPRLKHMLRWAVDHITYLENGVPS